MVLSKKIPVYYLIISMILGGFLPLLIYKFIVKPGITSASAEVPELTSATTGCDYNLTRLSGYEFIKPLVYADQNCESEIYAPLKTELFNQLQKFKTEGDVTEAAIYLRDMKIGTWMWLGETEKFEGDSFLNLPLLITYLRQSETMAGLLDRELTYNEAAVAGRYNGKTALQAGNRYKIKQLLLLMATSSDEAAENLLKINIDSAAFRKTFVDLGLQAPYSSGGYKTTVHDYAVFMMALYNAGYLTIQNSEYAMALLSRNNFNSGLRAAIPAGIKVAHTSGASKNEPLSQLMESAIVYPPSNPYLLVVMAKGRESIKLGAAISSLSGTIYARNKTANP